MTVQTTPMLQKTDKGRLELSPGQRTLGQRARSVLLMTDGSRSREALAAMFGGQGEAIVQKLIAEGYLGEGSPAQATSQMVAPPESASSGAAASVASGTSIGGKGSLAAIRMYLFDITERMFVRRDPALADAFRQALRAANGREDILETAELMLAHVQALAGAERAATIRQQIASL